MIIIYYFFPNDPECRTLALNIVCPINFNLSLRGTNLLVPQQSGSKLPLAKYYL